MHAMVFAWEGKGITAMVFHQSSLAAGEPSARVHDTCLRAWALVLCYKGRVAHRSGSNILDVLAQTQKQAATPSLWSMRTARGLAVA